MSAASVSACAARRALRALPSLHFFLDDGFVQEGVPHRALHALSPLQPLFCTVQAHAGMCTMRWGKRAHTNTCTRAIASCTQA